MTPRIIAVSLILVLGLSHAALAGPPGDEIRRAFSAADQVLNDRATEDKPMERLNAILGIVARVFAFRDAAELALGREWRTRTPAEQDEFTQLFANLLERSFVFTLATKARLEGGVQMRVLHESFGAGEAVVRTTVLSRSGRQIALDYRMIPRGDRWMIRDVVIDGVSVIENYHAQIRRVIGESSFGEVVGRMRAKVAELSELVAVVPERDVTSVQVVRRGETAGGPVAEAMSVRQVNDVQQAPIVESLVISAPVVAESASPPRDGQSSTAVVSTAQPAPAIARERRRAPDARVAMDAPRSADTRLATDTPRVANNRVAAASPPPARVTIEHAPRYWVQVGAFKNPATAQRLSAQLRDQKLPVWLAAPDAPDAGGLSRVRVGPYAARAEAVTMLHQLEMQGFRAFVVGGPDMAPHTPNARSASAKPPRSSSTR